MPPATMYRQIACDVFCDVRAAAASRGEQDAARALDALGWCRRADVDAARAARESASVADFLAAHALPAPPLYVQAWGFVIELMTSAQDQAALDHALNVAAFVQVAIYGDTPLQDAGSGIIERTYRQRRHALRYGPLPPPAPAPPVVWEDDLF
jgi:hypothetical protein